MRYFKSEVFNNRLPYKYIPIFSILSEEKNFCIDDIPQWLEKHTLNNIIVVCGGQQTLPFPDEKSSILYGKNFTGIQLVDYRTYKIHRKGNLAATLFDLYQQDSLIIDILDPRFNWETKPLGTTISLNFIFELLHRILNLVKNDPKIILVGFSRGATFAITLARWLESTTANRFVFSIDPVIAGWKNESIKHCIRSNGKWVIENECFHINPQSYFPIIANPGCSIWNVFQRKSFLSGFNLSEYPVGSAVEGAYSLQYTDTLLHEVPFLLSQWDIRCKRHQQMREKYIPSILDKISSIIHI